ncbi:GMP/IMP nucleotidase [Sulfuricystis multivorans]|uniref:GMP/IMP nucleotidase n=1 Tax=Sulfuricystis multivorans TaxID=2211108 RepID=UPI000F822537|nr:GMP/IMP nucleotidase [Sulfuricystis multivorans]
MIDWNAIDTVLLDMDGTLLDLHFDNHFWQAHVPLCYAATKGLTLDVAREELMARYSARAGTLDWYSVDYWESELELDIMRLKEEVAHLIQVHPSVSDFLALLGRLRKRVVLATNAHHKSITLKMAKTGLEPHFDAIVSAHALGFAKEQRGFWEKLAAIEPFEPTRTLLIDDSLPVLDAARDYGIRYLVAVRRPDTKLPPKDTCHYPAIDSFTELLT